MAEESKAMALLVSELRSRRFHPVRIEDKSSTGTPDLNFCCAKNRDIWVELKDATVERSGSISITLRPAQYAWMIEASSVGREVWLGIRIGGRWWAIETREGWDVVRKRFQMDSLKSLFANGFDKVSDFVDFISKPFSFIYFLEDPDNGSVRYVGYSKEPRERFLTHLYESRKKSTHKECWIYSLLKLGKIPTLRIVEKINNAPEREAWWISKLRKDGADLVNGTDGGEGLPGYKMTAENLIKNSQRMKKLNQDAEFKRTNAARASIRMTNLMKNESYQRKVIHASLAARKKKPFPKASEFMTKEQLSERARKVAASKTPEERSRAARLGGLANQKRKTT